MQIKDLTLLYVEDNQKIPCDIVKNIFSVGYAIELHHESR